MLIFNLPRSSLADSLLTKLARISPRLFLYLYVIPAQAGIQKLHEQFILDSRLRGNDDNDPLTEIYRLL